MLDLFIEGAVDAMEERGYHIIPGVFCPSQISVLRAASFMALTKLPHPSHLQTKLDTYSGVEFPALLFWPNSFSTVMRKFAEHPILQRIVKAFLGDNVRQLNNQYYYRLPGDGDQFAWHQDISFRTPKEDFPGIESRYLQTAIIVDNMSCANGGIEFIPGSHLGGDLTLVPRDNSESGLRDFQRGDRSGDKIIAEPGDVVVWSVMTVHGSGQNQSQWHRGYYMNGFAAADAVAPHRNEFPWYLKEGKLCTL